MILSKLVANAGVWVSNYGSIKLEYYWDRCNADGTGCVYLHTGRNHTVGAKDIGHVLRVTVFATNTKGTSMAVTQTAVIHSVPPVNAVGAVDQRRPRRDSERLTANPGAWTSPYGDKITVNYYWSRCDGRRQRLRVPAHGPHPRRSSRGHRATSMQVMFSVETDHGVAIAHVADRRSCTRSPPVNAVAAVDRRRRRRRRSG